jgi:hypothetical protein
MLVARFFLVTVQTNHLGAIDSNVAHLTTPEALLVWGGRCTGAANVSHLPTIVADTWVLRHSDGGRLGLFLWTELSPECSMCQRHAVQGDFLALSFKG